MGWWSVADLVTHMCTALIFKGLTRGGFVGPMVLGTVLPDLSSRVPTMLVDAAVRAGAPIPLQVMYPFAVLHMPIGNLALCGLLAFLFRRDQRLQLFTWLWIGSLFHFAVDMLQAHHGQGYYMLFPFTTATSELGVFGSEATIPWVPVTVAVTAAVWGWRVWRQRVASVSPAPYDDA